MPAARTLYRKTVLLGAIVREYSMTFRFYGQLNDFLPVHLRRHRFRYLLRAPASVKDVIEGLGVPHPEVDVILINGEAAAFTDRLQGREEVAVFPAFRSIDVGGVHRVGSAPPSPVRFVLDVHLGKLASLLRLAGFDALLLTDDADVANAAAAAGHTGVLPRVSPVSRLRSHLLAGFALQPPDPAARTRTRSRALLHRFTCRRRRPLIAARPY